MQTATMNPGGDLPAVQFNPSNISTDTLTIPSGTMSTAPLWYESGRIQIPLYAIIFILAVTGNSLVIVSLVRDGRLRTATNLYLLNLAVSDLLLGVMCMPFTLSGTLLRDFVFGEVMCKLIPFLQACSVSVGAWTLVAISVERYYAICHPLKALAWKSASHAYKVILLIWVGSFICMAPIAWLSVLKPTKKGKHKCREDWHSLVYEQAYNLFLDLILMVIPLLILALTYFLITRTLARDIRAERAVRDSCNALEMYVHLPESSTRWTYSCNDSSNPNFSWRSLRHKWFSRSASVNTPEEPEGTNVRIEIPGIRKTNVERSMSNKKRIIRMLFMVVLEFFVCWTPLFVINTLALFRQEMVYNRIGYTGISLFQLLAYSSSCCNPITYCFMNYGFKKTFLKLFYCEWLWKN